MTPQEAERRRRQRAQSDPARDREIALHQHRILSFLDWCWLNNISPATGRRILKSGRGPAVTRLSTRRIGISIAANAAWQAARSETDQGQEARSRAFEGRGQTKLFREQRHHQHQRRDRK
jgi:hypothetical protein